MLAHTSPEQRMRKCQDGKIVSDYLLKTKTLLNINTNTTRTTQCKLPLIARDLNLAPHCCSARMTTGAFSVLELCEPSIVITVIQTILEMRAGTIYPWMESWRHKLSGLVSHMLVTPPSPPTPTPLG